MADEMRAPWGIGLPPDGAGGQWIGEGTDGRMWVLQWCPERKAWFGAGHLVISGDLNPEYRWETSSGSYIRRHFPCANQPSEARSGS